MEAGESDADVPARQFVSWNEYEGPFSTLRFGGGFLYDYAAYNQDDVSNQQLDFTNGTKLRDFRFLLKGKFLKITERDVTWSAGIMWDEANEEWVMRQSGVMVELPKLSSSVFIGRTKEGFSMNKVMVGYHGWTHERAPVSDAMIPILADGIKWLGYLPDSGLNWSLGWYGDSYSSEQGFSTYEQQTVARVSWLPIRSNLAHTLLHLGVSLRDGEPEDGQLRLRARPESFQAPYVVDTGVFDTDRTFTSGLEAYWRSGPLLLGTELFFQDVDSPSTGDPTFNGYEAFVAWNITGETRPYKAAGAYFSAVSPARPVGQGGPGRDRARAALLGRGPRCGDAARRPLPPDHADGQLAPVGLHAPRVRVRLRQARSLRRDRHDPLFHRAAPAHAVTLAWRPDSAPTSRRARANKVAWRASD